MRVLIVANYNNGFFIPFVIEQAEALRKTGCEVDYYPIIGKGAFGYLRNRSGLISKIKSFKPDIIHAHYGLSGLLANLQRTIPVVTTFHGSDIHSGGSILLLSKVAMRLSSYNIFVTKKMKDLANYHGENSTILSCGLDLDTIVSLPRQNARQAMGLDANKRYALFSSTFTKPIKNPELAKAAVKLVPGLELIELWGYTRKQVNLLMNAVDVQLTTSHNESGPLVVKEAMACGTPVVSVDVGDVREVMDDTPGCYIAERTPENVAAKLREALSFEGKTRGRQRILDLGLDNRLVAKRIVEIYNLVLTS